MPAVGCRVTAGQAHPGARTRAALYCFATYPTRRVGNALVVPDITEFTKSDVAACRPGIVPTAEPSLTRSS